MSQPPEVQRFPATCPQCARVAGMPYMAATKRGAVKVSLRCRECHHEWLIEMLTNPGMGPGSTTLD